MKVVILAGGLGTRLCEETDVRPKPMVTIGAQPILWHIMKIYSHYGFNDFIICLGYKGYMIKEYFAHYFLHQCDITFDFTNNGEMTIHNQKSEPWRVTLVDTGRHSMTGGRVKRIQPYIGNETFMLTYGDGVGDINIDQLVRFHQQHGKLATVTSVQPEGRFGALVLEDDNSVRSFQEKHDNEDTWINAGFFVLEPEIFSLIPSDSTNLESEPMHRLTQSGNLMAYRHRGFWHPMDTLRDRHQLETLWSSPRPPWKIWQ